MVDITPSPSHRAAALPAWQRRHLAGLILSAAAALPSAAQTPDQHWQLLSHEGSKATLSGRDAGPAERVQVLSQSAPSAQPWHVQLVYGPLCIERGQGLLVSFRVRAERPRPLGFSLGLNRAPWTLLAPYRTLEVHPHWEDVVLFLLPEAGADPGRLVFDLAASDAAVEIDRVVVRRRDNSVSVVRSGDRCGR